MGIQPTDLGQDFVKKGMRLITQTSSDALMKKASDKKKKSENFKNFSFFWGGGL